MANQNKYRLNILAFNKNDQIKRLKSASDRLSDKVTASAGSSIFLALNIILFIGWIVINSGTLGQNLVFDKFPFGLLTMAVSLEAIILSIFVLISQNRQSKHSEIRSEMDYLTDLRADAEINVMISILERLANEKNIDISDLLTELDSHQKKLVHDHPVSKKDLEN